MSGPTGGGKVRGGDLRDLLTPRPDLLCRKGFALISVLWVLVGVSTLALAANVVAREAVATARNRADLTRAGWRGEECLERARAAISDALAAQLGDPRGSTAWGRLDAEIRRSPVLSNSGCDVQLRAAGAALDANAAGEEDIRRLLLALGRPPAQADSLVDALSDWRDADDTPRPRGAEHLWYAANGLRPPRNGPLADVRELRLVRGWGAVPGMDTLLSAEPGRVPLSHAPAAVLASIPGFGAEAIARVTEMRLRGDRIADLTAFAGTLSPGGRDDLARHYGEVDAAAVVEPEAWILTARGADGAPPAVRMVEVRLVLAGKRAAVVRRRTWIE